MFMILFLTYWKIAQDMLVPWSPTGTLQKPIEPNAWDD